ncbi:DNA excision repair protein ERCC-1 [Halotydeus destructor]|nr:DNA excision repair protein ERCC-1 [Halotydeus destructor]
MAEEDNDFVMPDLDADVAEKGPVRLFKPGMVLGSQANSSQLPKNGTEPSTSQSIKLNEPSAMSVDETVSNSKISEPAKKVDALKPNTLVVNKKQRENPLLKHLRIPWLIDEAIEPDYVLGRGMCGYFLSLKYHNLFPNYIYDRYNALGQSFGLRILLLMVDIPDPKVPLKELTKFALLTDSTLMCCWTFEEAARFFETYRLFENKSPEILMEKQFANNKGTEGAYECVVEALATVKKINKTDAIQLVSAFDSLEKIVKAPPEKLALCPGLGPLKAQQLHALFRKPFVRS